MEKSLLQVHNTADELLRVREMGMLVTKESEISRRGYWTEKVSGLQSNGCNATLR